MRFDPYPASTDVCEECLVLIKEKTAWIKKAQELHAKVEKLEAELERLKDG